MSSTPLSVQATDAPPATNAVTPDDVARLERAVSRVVRGKPEVVRLAVVSLLCEGHVLIEDVPGVGKTTLAQALARAVGLAFQRIQFTSDLLPSDIIGVSVYDQREQQFKFARGPLFANVVLADEINRATPKTQSALLEAMSERTVTVERRRFALPRPFLVLATQNPIEHQGTFPLPESQLDRFLMALTMGYPPRDEEKQLLLSGGAEAALENVSPAIDAPTLQTLLQRVREVRVADKLADYILALVEATRNGSAFALPVSTRGAQNLYRASQAFAFCAGRSFVIPDDVQRLAVPIFGHRVVLARGHGGIEEARAAIRQIVAGTPVPV